MWTEAEVMAQKQMGVLRDVGHLVVSNPST